MKKTSSYLESYPVRNNIVAWNDDEGGRVTLIVTNHGIFHFLTRKIFQTPEVRYIHLDEMGSFLWKRFDGSKTMIELGNELQSAFGRQAEPVYERLVSYIRILTGYRLIQLR